MEVNKIFGQSFGTIWTNKKIQFVFMKAPIFDTRQLRYCGNTLTSTYLKGLIGYFDICDNHDSESHIFVLFLVISIICPIYQSMSLDSRRQSQRKVQNISHCMIRTMNTLTFICGDAAKYQRNTDSSVYSEYKTSILLSTRTSILSRQSNTKIFFLIFKGKINKEK